jgi:hypothetical protein
MHVDLHGKAPPHYSATVAQHKPTSLETKETELLLFPLYLLDSSSRFVTQKILLFFPARFPCFDKTKFSGRCM